MDTGTMRVTADDGVALAAYETGDGPALLLIHEFGGDHRSWAPQVQALAVRYRCLTYDARNSMGGFAALHLGLDHPGRVRSLVVAGCGYGAAPERAAAFRSDALALAGRYEREGAAAVAAEYGNRPARRVLREHDPAAHAEHLRILAEHDPLGAALTMRGVQAARPSLYHLRDELAAMQVPTLLVVGDGDDDAIEANLMLRATLPDAGLAVLPRSGHLTNLEDPGLFNGLVERFHALVG